MDICFHVSCVYTYTQAEQLGHMISIYNILKNFHCFQNGCTILYFPQQCIKFPISTHPDQSDQISRSVVSDSL